MKVKEKHQHLPAPERIELRDLKNKVKKRVVNETTSVLKLYEEELAHCNLSSAALTLVPLSIDASKLFV